MTTTNLGMTIPTVGADLDNWGNDLNADLALIDTFATRATRQILTTGSAATYTTPANCRQLRIRMVGPGGGGAGSRSGAGNGGNGSGATIFKSYNAAAGNGGNASTGSGGTGGSGGSNGTGATSVLRIDGQGGQANNDTGTHPSGSGGGNLLGFGGQGVYSGTGSSGSGYGSGGQGAAEGGASALTGPGGGAGEYVELIFDSPSATYTYTIGTAGAGGTAGSGGQAGGPGKIGIIIVDEYY